MKKKILENILIAGIIFFELVLFVVLPGCAEPASKAESAYLLERTGYEAYQDHRWVDAEKDYRQASKLDPQNLKYRNNLSVILYREGKRKEAEKLLDLARIKKSRAGKHILINRANVLLEKHQYQQAREILGEIRLSRSWPTGFRRLMAYADIRTGHYGEASLLLHEIIRTRHRDPVVLGYLSILYKKEGEESLAQKNFQQALNLSPSPGFRKSLALLFKETTNGTKETP